LPNSGRDRLSPRLHLATIWMVSLGTVLSALFILATNSWMQHPVGYKVVGGNAVLTNFWAVLGNPVLWGAFTHTVLAALTTAGAVMLGISTWRAHRSTADPAEKMAATGALYHTRLIAPSLPRASRGRFRPEPRPCAAHRPC
jgi:cytochrome d ubiquinol oxidase subunit I